MSEQGHYIHEATDQNPRGTKVMRQIVRGEEQVWVSAEDFMVVQKERDDYRRTLALINACRTRVLVPRIIVELLMKSGFKMEDAEAMREIIDQFGPRT